MMKKFVVLLAALAMVLGFTAAAMADASLYGSARFVTFWHDKDDDYGSKVGDDDQDLEWQMGKLSRFGVKFQQGDITGRFEVDARIGADKDQKGYYRLGSANLEDTSGSSRHGNIRLRHLWGAWDFGPGELCIGHRHSLFTYYISQFGNNAGAGMAHFSGSNLAYFRVAQIRLTFGNLKLAFLTPDTDIKPIVFATGAEEALEVDTELPRIEVAYTMKLEPVTLDFMAGWQSFEVEDTATGDDEDVQSYVALVKAATNFGPLYVKGLLRYAQNGGNYGVWTNCDEKAYWHNNDVKDNQAFGYGLGIGYKFSDMITVEAAFSGTDAENSDLPGDPEDDMQVYGILCKITPAPGVTIQPEIMLVDQEESDYKEALLGTDDQGDELRIGVFWKIDFK